MQTRKNEIWVGIFLLLALLAALFICLRAADITSIRTEPTYRIYATFDNIGGLKARSPVRIGGVVIGRVSDITLDEKTYLPRVAMDIEERYNHIPDTSPPSIRTSGLLGDSYIGLQPGGAPDNLQPGGEIAFTQPAVDLIQLVGKYMFGGGAGGDAAAPADASGAPAPTTEPQP